MSVSPVQQALATKSVVRGSPTTFEVAFLETDGSPIVPVDPNMYPAVSITDSDGFIVDSGVGVSIGDGRWRYQMMIPADATLSTDEAPWRIDWNIVTVTNRQATLSQNFAVIDSMSLLPNDRTHQKLVFLNQPERLLVKFRKVQSQVRLVLTDQGGGFVDLSGQIQYQAIEGWHVYFVDTPPWTGVGQYLATWNARQCATSDSQVIVQVVRVPPQAFWFMQTHLRSYIDKVQKKAGHVQAQSDADMYEYLIQGMNIVNSVNPISSYSLHDMTDNNPLTFFVTAAAAWWGLGAQFISEGELAFDFSGQTVTLAQDKTGTYDAAMSRLWEVLSTRLEQTKKNMMRQRSSGGFAGRPVSYRHGPRMAQIGHGSDGGASAIVPLAQLGVFLP